MTTENTLSTPFIQTEDSNSWINITRFGQKIIHELNIDKGSSILSRWMAQRVAELIRKVELTTDEVQREVAAKECTELIFRLWEKRDTWPSGGPLADIYPTFKRLFGSRDYYHRFLEDEQDTTGIVGKLIALHEREMKLFINSPNVAVEPKIIEASQAKLELYTDQLTEEERELLLFTAQRMIEEDSEEDLSSTGEVEHILHKTQDTFERIEKERLALIEEAFKDTPK